MILVTAATGKLGLLAVEALLTKVSPKDLAVGVRHPEKAEALAARGVEIRKADYDVPATLEEAFRGVDKLLLISGSEPGKRAAQHKSAITAAKKAGVKLIVYTSLLHADTSGIALAEEHKITEAALRASGVPYVLLRNGWYIENYTENLAPALEYGAILGSAGEGKVAAATRADLAAAAAAVLTTEGHENRTYELAGDHPFSMGELAAEVARASGKPVVYKDLPAEDYAGALAGAGVPRGFAEILADSDLGIARGELNDARGDLRRLIGRATTPLSTAVATALGK